MDSQRREDLISFYSILDDLEHSLGGARRLASAHGLAGAKDPKDRRLVAENKPPRNRQESEFL